jgi:hypothetical protein
LTFALANVKIRRTYLDERPMPMTAATLTPSATAADMLEELRQLLGRHDGAETLEQLRELTDELSTVLRRARGRIGRLARQQRPAPDSVAKPETLEPKQEEPPAAQAVSAPADAPAAVEVRAPQPPRPPAARPTFAAPLPPPEPVVIEIRPDRPAADPPPAPPPAETPPAAAGAPARGFPVVVGLVLTVLAALWGTAARPGPRTVRRTAAAVRTVARRTVAAAGPYARRFRAAARAELDRWLE